MHHGTPTDQTILLLNNWKMVKSSPLYYHYEDELGFDQVRLQTSTIGHGLEYTQTLTTITVYMKSIFYYCKCDFVVIGIRDIEGKYQ